MINEHQDRLTPRHSPIVTAVHYAGLFCLTAAVYREDCLRVPGLEGGLIGRFLYVIRGIIYVHYTYLVWFIVAAGIVLTPGRRTETLWRVRACLFFLVWVAFYAMRSIVSDMGPIGAHFRLQLLFLYQLPVLLPLLLLRFPGAVIAVRNWFFWAGTIQVLASIILRKMTGASLTDLAAGQEFESGRLILQSDTITTALLLFQTAFCGMSILMDGNMGRRTKGVAYGIVPVTIFLALSTGSRGPIVSFVGVLALLLGFSAINARKITPFIAGAVFAMVAAVLLMPMYSEKGGERLRAFGEDVLSRGTSEESTLNRLRNFTDVLESKPTFMGNGVASFGLRVGDPKDYPHNLFLEAYYETGLLGLLLFASVIIYYFSRAAKITYRRPSHEHIFCLTCLTFYLSENMFSGTFAGSAMWAVFLILGAWTTARAATVRFENRRGMPNPSNVRRFRSA